MLDRLEYSTKKFSIKKLVALHMRGNLRVDWEDEVEWDSQSKADYIRSVLYGYPLFHLTFQENKVEEDTSYKVIEGTPQINSLLLYSRNFIRVNNSLFTDLSLSEQRKFLSKLITVVVLSANNRRDFVKYYKQSRR